MKFTLSEKVRFILYLVFVGLSLVSTCVQAYFGATELPMPIYVTGGLGVIAAIVGFPALLAALNINKTKQPDDSQPLVEVGSPEPDEAPEVDTSALLSDGTEESE